MEVTLILNTKRGLRFKAEEFNNLRGFIILHNMNIAVEVIGMRFLMDCMDAVRDLKIGETIFCTPSKNNCYWSKELAKVNDRANFWEKKRNEYPEYAPVWSYAFAIKRTEKGWVYRDLDYKFN